MPTVAGTAILPTWYAAGNAYHLEPVDDVVDDVVDDLIQKHGKVTAAVKDLGKQKGQWRDGCIRQ